MVDKDDVGIAVWCILGVISFILALFCGQYFANYMHATGMMWWVFAIIGYVVSGAIFAGISWGIIMAYVIATN